ncbi:MAG: helix-turn-helix transcriptional regulator [Eubacteriales bacterium]|nr:helix-turn-helix transcriptional regulator [Eubacteriales bacterium]
MLQDKIRELRRKNNLSQKDVAERLNVSRQTISKWECGLAVPDADSLALIADLFSVDVNYLLAKETDVDSTIVSSANATSSKPATSTSEFENKMKYAMNKSEKLKNHSNNMESVDFEWENFTQQLEQYNAIQSQRLSLIKSTIKWVLILLVGLCFLVFAYKIYEMHFFAIKSAEQVPIETMELEIN